jgi:hypothetical protein
VQLYNSYAESNLPDLVVAAFVSLKGSAIPNEPYTWRRCTKMPGQIIETRLGRDLACESSKAANISDIAVTAVFRSGHFRCRQELYCLVLNKGELTNAQGARLSPAEESSAGRARWWA